MISRRYVISVRFSKLLHRYRFKDMKLPKDREPKDRCNDRSGTEDRYEERITKNKTQGPNNDPDPNNNKPLFLFLFI